MFYKIYKNKDLYEKETLNIIKNTVSFIGSNDIQIIYNIELFNDNINNYINNYIDCDDIYNIELKRKSLIQYLNIIINIIDNVIYEKGYVIKKEEINQLINNPFINNPFINIIFTVLFVLFVLFIIIFYNIPNLKYYYKYYLTNIF